MAKLSTAPPVSGQEGDAGRTTRTTRAQSREPVPAPQSTRPGSAGSAVSSQVGGTQKKRGRKPKVAAVGESRSSRFVC